MFQNEKIPVLGSLDEKVVETRTCKHCFSSFDITNKDLKMYEKLSPSFGGKKYPLPFPTLCPDCREQRRLAFRNERYLYKRKCSATKNDIVSIYSPDKAYKVYSQEFWWSDKWNALDYGRRFDFEESFFDQFDNLLKNVPLVGTMNSNSINSDYSNRIVNMKDTYFVYRGHDVENCMYSSGVAFDTHCIDISISKNCENCGELVDCRNCYELFYSSNCVDCEKSTFLDNCIGCSNCFACSNLINKKYYIFNKEYTKEKYKEEIKKIQIGNYSQLKKLVKLFKTHAINFPKRPNFSFNSESSSGEYLVNSKNSQFCFDSSFIEDCKYIFYGVDGVKDSYDCSFIGKNSECCYESVSCLGYGNNFSIFIMHCNRVLYSVNCHNCSDCFGCVGLKDKKYCILNKEYSREEYERLVPKIIEHMKKTGEWGEFFPASISPFGYNETVAMEYYPARLSEDKKQMITEDGKRYEVNIIGNKNHLKSSEDIIGKSFNWSNYEAPFPKVEKIIPASKLPESIKNIPNDILNRAIECEVSKKPFRIVKEELDFYRKHNLPIPKKHPDERHKDRMKLRNPRKLYKRNCDKCGIEIKTSYAPERPEIVYCQTCYNREVY